MDWYQPSTGKIVRKYLNELLEKSRILIFYFSIWFKVFHCTIYDHWNFQFPNLVNHLRIYDVFLTILKDFRKTDILLNVITEEEWKTLEGPSCQQQDNELAKIIESINDSKFQKLVDSIGYKFLKGELFKHENGIVNSIFVLIVENKQNENKKLFLKIIDTHPVFKNKKTLNEVSIMKHVNENTSIPVPEILSYSNDASSSLIDCEYI